MRRVRIETDQVGFRSVVPMREMLEGDRPVIIEMPRRDDSWILTGVIVPEIDRRRECAREISLGVAGGREE